MPMPIRSPQKILWIGCLSISTQSGSTLAHESMIDYTDLARFNKHTENLLALEMIDEATIMVDDASSARASGWQPNEHLALS